jgi:hypothetical protein
MKISYTVCLLTLSFALTAQAQDKIYRCGNEYTNTVTEAQSKNCKLISGGNVTVVQGSKASTGTKSASASPGPSPGGSRVSSDDQRAKDSDSRLILEAELRKAEARQVELAKEYNNGEPEKLGPEARNYQKYLDRVAELKATIARNDSDIAGLRRELGRVGGAPSPSTSASNK